MEEWKDIQGYEGLYQVSNYGNVKSLPRVIMRSNNHPNSVKERILKFALNSGGYPCVNLHKDDKQIYIRIHFLVWDNFSDEDRKGYHVDHIDENKKNNRFDNLQLLTSRNNNIKSILYRKTNGLPIGVFKPLKGQYHYRSAIRINGKQIHLGTFNTPELAAVTYQKALESLLTAQ